MKKIFSLNEKNRTSVLFNFRLRFIALIFFLVFIIFFFQIFNLSVLNNIIYQTASENNRIINIPLYSNRGLIYNENGDLLVDNIVFQKLTMVPGPHNNFEKVLEEVREELEISDEEIQTFKKSLENRTYKYQPITLVRKLSQEQIARFSLKKSRWPSVKIEAGLMRHVLDGSLYSHVLGYLGQIDIEAINSSLEYKYPLDALVGKAGIEKFYERQLRGSVGYKTIEANVHGIEVREIRTTSPVKAPDIKLSIDRELQVIARDSLKDKKGTVIALDPSTGLIKALVSFPDYDPSLFNLGKIEKLHEIISNKDAPLFNRAISGNYPPASTIKPFLGILGLNEDKLDWRTEIEDKGSFQITEGGRVFKGWKEDGHGMVNLSKALIESSDVFFYQLALKLKIGEISNFLMQIGFGSLTNIDLDNEQSGVVPDKRWKLGNIGSSWYLGDTVNIGIGQGYMTATPIQLAVATSALANKGDAFQPRVVKKIGSEETARQLLYSIKTDSNNWKKMESSLMNVISAWNGTAHNVFDPKGPKIAGKTGTAQISSLSEEEDYSIVRQESSRRDHALFIGYGPVPDPSLVIVVVIEYGESGSIVAAPIAKKMFDHYFSSKL